MHIPQSARHATKKSMEILGRSLFVHARFPTRGYGISVEKRRERGSKVTRVVQLRTYCFRLLREADAVCRFPFGAGNGGIFSMVVLFLPSAFPSVSSSEG